MKELKLKIIYDLGNFSFELMNEYGTRFKAFGNESSHTIYCGNSLLLELRNRTGTSTVIVAMGYGYQSNYISFDRTNLKKTMTFLTGTKTI